MGKRQFRHLEINGGIVTGERPMRLLLPPVPQGYADAQINDYGPDGAKMKWSRGHFPWRPGVKLSLSARFSHPVAELAGTAGFGFWNAPFGDPSIRWPALPQATWFFYASPATNLPLALSGPGRGWFASTLDATTASALALAPFAPMVLLLHQSARLRRRIWPAVRRRLRISYAQIAADITDWHTYELHWLPHGCRFYVDGRTVLQTPFTPRGPLGFVCWLDNQYMVVTIRGRVSWGVLSTQQTQWLEVADLNLEESPQILEPGRKR